MTVYAMFHYDVEGMIISCHVLSDQTQAERLSPVEHAGPLIAPITVRMNKV